MKYLSVCSGIEAATVAWKPLGWSAVAFSEIEPFPSALLKHHYPTVPNLGDMTKFQEWDIEPIDLLVGGTPCQSFSVAGLRKGLDDPRGNLMLTYLAIAAKFGPKWLVWENVPGVLSADGGTAFGAMLGGLAELGYGFAYRILDAQYVGVPQRRRRVFVVGYFGDWRRAAAVLFERHSLSGHPAPRRKTGQEVTGTLGARTKSGGGFGGDFETTGGLIANALHASDSLHAVRRDSDNLIPAIVGQAMSAKWAKGTAGPAGDEHHNLLAVAFQERGREDGRSLDIGGDVAYALTAPKDGGRAQERNILTPAMQVRRLTPRECERLQGFPDDYSLVTIRNKPAADGPRYKALGNSMAVPCMAWIGERIQEMNATQHVRIGK